MLALLPIVVFALLDAKFLRNERRFRQMYDTVRQSNWADIPSFEIDITKVSPTSYWSCLGSWSILSFYVLLAAAIIAVALAAGYTYGRFV